ncbi:tRNA (adenosine(37)-N6)-dimethylallyltransferase MiaA [Fulvimarina sp. MAC8]|uniref:tRNA (adenosine(37)-N6)-dimethylallyltransferase MiaA n=1 Tax=Fulvimarina sp. MAC8 TaxID=3162874 RepID=UPI0032EE59EA
MQLVFGSDIAENVGNFHDQPSLQAGGTWRGDQGCDEHEEAKILTDKVPEAVLIAGPTASGKSRLALDLAQRLDGWIVNADSLQVYRDLPILTARPTEQDEEAVPHALYGHLAADEPMSAGRYVREAATVLDACRAKSRMPIFCGGTGLYFKALLGLLDSMPQVPAAIRDKWRARLVEDGPEMLHQKLSSIDPATAERVKPKDGQRIVRALEIYEATGKPLSELQAGRGEGILEGDNTLKIVLTPDRAVLRDRIAKRFDQMLEAGAMDEVRDYLARRPEEGRFVEKAIGFTELSGVLAGEAMIDAARERAITRTRQYAKRQETWFRHQFDDSWLRCPDVAEALSRTKPMLEAVKT